MRFWDSSAVVTRVLDEPSSPRTRPVLAEDPTIAIWWATPVECVSAIWRAQRATRVSEELRDRAIRSLATFLAPAAVVQPTSKVLDRARVLIGRYPLRSADALQLAAAVDWADDSPTGFAFVCLDDRLRGAAQAEGFRVLPA